MRWIDHPSNPLISPPFPSWLIGDPTVLLPRESPDNMWHLFANSLLGIYHHVSEDGVVWKRKGMAYPSGIRAWVLKEDNFYYLFFQLHYNMFLQSGVVVMKSKDLRKWSKPVYVLLPTLVWEGAHVSNPCVIKTKKGYMMYYSANTVFLPDMGFSEPLYISVAFSDNPEGPYEKLGKPIISPSPLHPWRNRGAGAIKVYTNLLPEYYVGFNNGIYARKKDGLAGSAILLMRSKDGITWEEYQDNPIVTPTDPVKGWKRAHVYQMDVKRYKNMLLMYYNARDGWRIGIERIGLSILPDAKKLWE